MTKSSIKVKYLSTVHPHFRDGLLKAEDDDGDVSENDSIFHFSPHDYYSSRELHCIDGIDYEEDEKQEDYWKKLALSEFWSSYDIVYKSKSNNPNSKQNPKHIPLKNGIGYIRRRKERCILRYYLNFENDEDFKRGLLILFFPFEDELIDIHQQDINQLYKDNEESIKANFPFLCWNSGKRTVGF